MDNISKTYLEEKIRGCFDNLDFSCDMWDNIAARDPFTNCALDYEAFFQCTGL